jgi:hypothetical protein
MTGKSDATNAPSLTALSMSMAGAVLQEGHELLQFDIGEHFRQLLLPSQIGTVSLSACDFWVSIADHRTRVLAVQVQM